MVINLVFNFKKSKIYRAVVFYDYFPAGLLKFCRILFFALGVVPLILLIVDWTAVFFGAEVNIGRDTHQFLGWSFIFFPLALSTLFFELFGNYYLKNPTVKSTNNIADLLEYEAAKVFERAFEISSSTGEENLSVRNLLRAAVEDDVLEKLLTRVLPDFKIIKKQVKELIKDSEKPFSRFTLFTRREISPEVMELLEKSLALRDKHGSNKISILDIMASMYDYDDVLMQFVIDQGLDKSDLEELAEWYEHIWFFWREHKKFWNLSNLLRQSPVGKDWVFGYARHLTTFSKNLTDKAEFANPSLKLTTRQKEISQIEQILSRSEESNVFLVGEEGVGKDNIVLDFAELIAKGRALPQLNYKKVFDLDLAMIAGASKEITDVQNILVSVFNESVKAGNIVLILKNFHNYIGEIEGLGRIDVSEILIPYLKSSGIQVIATTNPQSFHRFIEKRSDVMEVFERVNIFEPDKTQTLKVIEESIPAIEAQSGVLITYGAIKEIVEGSDKFIRSVPFPEKAFDLLSETISYASANSIKIITKKEIHDVLSRKTGVPLGPIVEEEKDKLANLEEILHRDIIGQDRAVEVIAATMRRLRTGLSKSDKPAGVFLFTGPTGVGKTLTAKILAKTYFGSKDRMLRFDMSEYQDTESLNRFLGSTRTNEPGQFVTAVSDNPFSLILLDELEKANKNILNIFLQVFDEGSLTDVFGRKINFEQNIIIATSNAGADQIRELVKQGFDPSLEKERIIDVMIKGKHFSPEFLNRFDEVVVFHPLSQEHVAQITVLLLNALSSRLKEQGYIFRPTQDVVDYIAQVGFDPQFGARPMERVIRDKIESLIAKKILEGSIQKGKEFFLSSGEVK